MFSVTVSMKMSPKQAGALYMKGIKQEKTIGELTAKLEQVKTERDMLIDTAEHEAVLPSASYGHVRELVYEIKKDALDMGGCYEVSTAKLEDLFEAFRDEVACRILRKMLAEAQIKALEDLDINPQNESEDRVLRIIERRIDQINKGNSNA